MFLLRLLTNFIILSNCFPIDEKDILELNDCNEKEDDIATAHKCDDCICDYGHIICTPVVCEIDEIPEGCKLILRQDECCPIIVCGDALPALSSAVCKEGAFVYTSNPCQSCVCKSNTIICQIAKCEIRELSPGCQEVSSPGECCPEIVCATTPTPQVLVSPSRACYRWEAIPSSSPCEKCFCSNGKIICAELQCPEVKVPSGCRLVKMKDECCLVTSCSIRIQYTEYTACMKRLPLDTPCRKCRCEAGRVLCTTLVCPHFRLAPNCRAVTAEGQCCASVECSEVAKQEIGY